MLVSHSHSVSQRPQLHCYSCLSRLNKTRLYKPSADTGELWPTLIKNSKVNRSRVFTHTRLHTHLVTFTQHFSYQELLNFHLNNISDSQCFIQHNNMLKQCLLFHTPAHQGGTPVCCLTTTGLRWSLLVSASLHWSPLVSAGLHWSPLVSSGLHWSPLVSAGLHWSPLVSASLHWSVICCVFILNIMIIKSEYYKKKGEIWWVKEWSF